MKLRIFALVAAMMTICTCTPLKAETFGDARGWHRRGQAVIVIPVHKQHRLYHPYRRQNRMYRHHYRYKQLYHPLNRYYGIYQPPRYKYNRLYYPRRSNLLLRIGF
jgi:hypothetical protein